MTAGRSDLQGSLGCGLAPDIREVGVGRLRSAHQCGDVYTRRLDRFSATEVGAHLQKGVGSAYIKPLDHCGLGKVGVRQQNATDSCVARGQCHRQSSSDRPKISLEADFAHDRVIQQELLRELSAGDENAKRNR